MTDRRDREHRQTEIRDGRMVVLIRDDEGEETEHLLPFKYEVCGTCTGRGKHVNPSIDCDGISQEDFDRDPDFKDEYFSGMYDVSCVECSGLRVVPQVDEEACSPEQALVVATLHEQLEEDWANDAERDAERRMGC